ncbi:MULTISPECIES: hypothetical protein [unclassified Carboxylicivirga]|uniref:hypothetical protein n=1 Tax=Carboxylicivirga TaxID=1628153 RepID=UPI003D33E044
MRTQKKHFDSFHFLLSLLSFNLLLIVIALLWGYGKNELAMKFEEYGFITTFSFIQLFITGLISFFTYLKRKKLIWILVALGFVFLSLDEKFLIHEQLDTMLHELFNMKETALSDRIDDFLILGYGLIGLVFLIRFRTEFLRHKTGVAMLSLGFGVMVLSVIFDTLGNSNTWDDIFSGRIPSAALHQLGIVVEESLKITAEAFLLSGFYAYLCYYRK